MFQMLEAEEHVGKAQRTFEATLRSSLPRRVTRTVGYPGGRNVDAPLRSDGAIWFFTEGARDEINPRRLNWFGLLSDANALSITVEINTPYRGRNDRVSGFYARDAETGTIYLMHSGRVGGGQTGVGKMALLAWSGLKPVDVLDGNGKSRRALVVMPIEGRNAIHSLTSYIDIVARFKEAVRAGVLANSAFQTAERQLRDYFNEPSGRRKGKRSAVIDYVSRHGDVVEAVRKWRLASSLPNGSRIAKNILIDLCVAKGNAPIEVFEVKTSAGRSDVYAAIGQLMVHGADEDCRRIIVLPHDEAPPKDLADALRRLRIEQLSYELVGKRVKIFELSAG